MRRSIVIAAAAALLVSVPLAGPATAASHQVHVTAVMVGGTELTGGEQSWIGSDCAGVWSARGLTGRQWWTGDPYLQGEAVVTVSMKGIYVCGPDGYPTLKSGRLWGSTRWEPYAFSGGWQAEFDFLVTSEDAYGWTYSGPVVGKGFGDLEGHSLVLRGGADGTIPPEQGSHTGTGFVLLPGGR